MSLFLLIKLIFKRSPIPLVTIRKKKESFHRAKEKICAQLRVDEYTAKNKFYLFSVGDNFVV